MKLHEARIGDIVSACFDNQKEIIGHIVGLKNNRKGEIMFIVKWASGGKYLIHPNHVKKITGEDE